MGSSLTRRHPDIVIADETAGCVSASRATFADPASMRPSVVGETTRLVTSASPASDAACGTASHADENSSHVARALPWRMAAERTELAACTGC
jgi:hypothetical protein